MTKTVEERISSLEENVGYLREGVARVEKAIERLESTLSGLVDKMDGRYPSKESVDLRMQELVRDVKALRERQDVIENQMSRMSAWQYRVVGGIVVISFILGVLSHFWGW